jgi:hypothetical protein
VVYGTGFESHVTPSDPSQAVETSGAQTTVRDASPASAPIQNPSAPFDEGTDAVELALAETLERASVAGEWSTVAVLVRELEARRAARQRAAPEES